MPINDFLCIMKGQEIWFWKSLSATNHSFYPLLLNSEAVNECAEEITKDCMMERVIVSNKLPGVADGDD